ncbi:hypothetical protein Tsubulata_045460 [Turnera subulata]|uniref:RING-type domain-containing protein n=1 Tax=Turnera subulata TaxID=218843 RepID=A0A9Q0J338_9ROSI|nr:hypothetical protein Tsubulata_045460 [Turnera subulata]
MNHPEATTDTSSSSTSSNGNPCPICLGPFLEESYLDTCFHKFCYKCIVQWTKVVAKKHFPSTSVKCPLCKRENFSIIYGYDGSSFQRHYLTQNSEHRSFFSREHKYRLQCYYTEPGVLKDIINVSRYWKSGKYLQQNRWLLNWLRRDLQALMQEEEVDIIVHHILGVIDSFLGRTNQIHHKGLPETKQEEFKELVSNAARPFLAAKTDRFVQELEMFLASGFNIGAYDEVYLQRLGWNTTRSTSEDTEGETNEHTSVVPYLYIFDEDSDETD